MTRPVNLFDAHCHLEDRLFYGKLPMILDVARQVGVAGLCTCSTRSSEWRLSREISQKNSGVIFACGIHPWFVEDESIEIVTATLPRALAGASALGEIGLDAKIESPRLNLQIPFFERQLSIAREHKLPVILHCRGAYSELFSIIKRGGPLAAGGIIHSFGGGIEEAKKFESLGLSFSLGGVLTRKPGERRIEMLKYIYPRLIHLESDSPAMLPLGLAGDVNVPANILYNLKAGAGLIGVTPEELAAASFRNSTGLFIQKKAE